MMVLSVSAAGGQTVPSPLRPQSARLQRAVQLGLHGSATFRSVVDALAGRDVVVVIVGRPCDFGRREACFLHQVVSAGGYRFLRIQIRDDVPFARLAGLVSHELWHAVEWVRAEADFDRFVAARGHECEASHFEACYETDEAVEVEGRVVAELSEAAARR
jgi:hypothetical protein